MKVQDIMTSDIETLYSDQTVAEAAKAMEHQNVGAIPVINRQNELLGIITDRDIVLRNVAANQDPNSMRIENTMTTDLICVSPQDDVKDAARVMAQQRVRRLPVVEGDEVIGMVSLGDFAAKDLEHTAGNVLEDVSQPIGPQG